MILSCRQTITGHGTFISNIQRHPMNAEDRNGPVIETQIDEFVALLERVVRREPVTEDEMRAVRWSAEGEIKKEIEAASHTLYRFDSDSDIRAKDPEYEELLLG